MHNRINSHRFIISRVADIIHLLVDGEVYGHISSFQMFPYDHSLIDWLSWVYEDWSSLLEFEDSIHHCLSGSRRNHRSDLPLYNFSFIRFIVRKSWIHNSFPLRREDKLSAKSKESSGWNDKFHRSKSVFWAHILHKSFTRCEHINHRSWKPIFNANDKVFHWLKFLSVFFFVNYLRCSNLKLPTFSPDRFNQYSKVQLSSSWNNEFSFHHFHFQTDISFSFFF